MRYILISLLTFFFSLLVHAHPVLDDKSHRVNLAKPARHIISLAPDITEILFSIGAGPSVIGVVSGSDYPSAAKNITVVGSYNGIDIEKVVSMKPDLIVTWSNTFTRQLQVLKNLGIPVYTTEPRFLEDIPRTIINLGVLTGKEPEAKNAAEQFLKRLTVLRKQYEKQQPISVFYQIGSYSLITVNKDSWINQVIAICGGRNVFADARSIAPEVSWESLVMADPQVILSSASNADWQMAFKRYPQITAVKKGFLFSVNPDWMNRAGPRLLNAVENVCHQLQVVRLQT